MSKFTVDCHRFCVYYSYGLVPDVDTLSFICTACNGCVMIYGEQV